jgi:hypothetical protein
VARPLRFLRRAVTLVVLVVLLPFASCALIVFVKPMEVRQDWDVNLAVQGQDSVILRRTLEWPVIGMAGDIQYFDNVIWRDRRGRERLLARYTTADVLESTARGPGCARLGKPPAAVRDVAVTAEWPAGDMITIRIGLMNSTFAVRVEKVAGLGITYEVGCVNHP